MRGALAMVCLPKGMGTSSVKAIIVVPCFDEETRFDTHAFDRFLSVDDRIDFVLVNDGSRDQTLARLEAVRQRWPDRIEVIDQQPNRGKGEAVRQGMLRALSRDCGYAGYWDADLATPLEAIGDFVRTMEMSAHLDIVLGARVALLGRQIERRAVRHYAGRVFATAVSTLLSLPVYDTQCGAKLFRAREDVRALFAEPFVSRWIFDVELLARFVHARREQAVDAIYELPLQVWRDVGTSKVKTTDCVRAAFELLELRRRYGAVPARFPR